MSDPAVSEPGTWWDRHGRSRPFAIALLLAVLALQYAGDTPVQRALRAGLFDTYQFFAPRIRLSAPVVIVAIDEVSLARYGQWPWPRTLLARLIKTIAAGQPAAIGVDIIMPEPDRMSTARLAELMPGIDRDLAARLSALPTNDTVLAAALKDSHVVLGVAGLDEPAAVHSQTPLRHPPFISQGGDPQPYLRHFVDALRSLDEIDQAAAGHGLLSADQERGVVRRVPLAASIGGELLPALAVEMLRVASGEQAVRVRVGKSGVQGVGIGDLFVPSEPDGKVWVHYTAHDPDRFISATDVLSGKTPPGEFERKLVLLGLTGIGLIDYQATPAGDRMPGVEIHAQLIEGIFDGKLLSRPDWLRWIEAWLLAVWGALLVLAMPSARPKFAILLMITATGLVFGSGFFLYKNLGLLFDVAMPIAGATLLFGVMLGISLIEADRQRRALKQVLQNERDAAVRVAGELEAARRIQMGILPQSASAFPNEKRFELGALLEPAKQVGGDLYDFFMLDDEHLFFLIGDVSGKGLPASLFMAVSKSLYKSAALRRLPDVSAVMKAANAEISRDNAEMLFVTAFAGILNVNSGQLEFCNAGHDAPYRLIPQRGRVEKLSGAGGPPVCALEDFSYQATLHQMVAGETLCLITDGVTEAMNTNGELYGHARLEKVLAETDKNTNAALVMQAMHSAVKNFTGAAEPADDITILVIRWVG
ncbi:MAG: CHASE2 domain-containing protein [Burkholderiales bacterium]